MGSTFKKYYRLAKPGIVYGNLLTTVAAFLFASRWHFRTLHLYGPFVACVLGISLVIASACVFNNFLDRHIDKRMKRTKNRALVTGAIPVCSALVYATLLGFVGFALLGFLVNILTAGIALFGFIFYVIIYGFAKRVTSWAAIIGSIPGAVPIVVGYTAVTNHLDATAIILFLILAFWQMPHFYAIAMYRLEEYTAAGIPVLPARKGMFVTKVHILAFIIAYLIATIAFDSVGNAGYFYLFSIIAFGADWLWRGIQGFKLETDMQNVDGKNAGGKGTVDTRWARKTFLFSLIVLVSFCVTISLAPLVP